jgi:hypothetical protein
LTIAKAQQMAVEEVFASAFADQLASWQRLRERAVRGNREEYFAVLDSVPKVEPDPSDRI